MVRKQFIFEKTKESRSIWSKHFQSPDLNSLNYYVWEFVEKETNLWPLQNQELVTIVTMMANMNENYQISGCSCFRG